MKILLIGEFSGLQTELKKGLVKLGHDVTLAAANDYYKNFSSDINLGNGSNLYSYNFRKLVYPFLNLRKFCGYDIVHVENFYTIPKFSTLNLLFLNYLKSNNGMLTMSGAGDDPFFVSFSKKTMRYNPISPHEIFDRGGRPHDMRKKSQLRAMHEGMKIVDFIIPTAYEYYSTFLFAGYSSKTSPPIPIPIDVKKYKPNFDMRERLLFFHGLTRPGFKGTFLIKEAFDKLSTRYPNDVECVINGRMAFDDYLPILSKTNVSVDQIYSYSLAMNALYSMAQGKIVCGGAEIESAILYDGQLPPIFNLIPNADSIYETFIEILDQKDKLLEISESSRMFVEEYHDGLRVAQRYIDCWSSISPSSGREV